MIIALAFLVILGSPGARAVDASLPKSPISINQCNQLLERPERWSADALPQAIEIIEWIYVVQTDQVAALATAPTGIDFLQVYFAATAYGVAPVFGPMRSIAVPGSLIAIYKDSLANPKRYMELATRTYQSKLDQTRTVSATPTPPKSSKVCEASTTVWSVRIRAPR